MMVTLMMVMKMTMKVIVMVRTIVMKLMAMVMMVMMVTLMTSHPQGFWLNWFRVAFRHQCYFKASQMTLMYSQD